MSKSLPIVTSESGWRQVRSKIVGDQRIFKVEAVQSWEILEDGAAIPVSIDDFHLVEIVSPLCEDTEERLLQRARARILH